MTKSSLVLAIWLAWTALALPASSAAFVRSPADNPKICFFWAKRTIPWTMNDKGAASVGFQKTRDALRASFDEWESVPCAGLSFQEQAPTAENRIGFNKEKGATNTNLLVFRPDLCEDVVRPDDRCWEQLNCSNLHNCWDFSQSTIAVTTTTYRQDNGEILDSDIEFNEGTFLFTTVDSPSCQAGSQSLGCVATDIRNTATHEVGHFIGLDHTRAPESEMATMLPKAALGDTFMRTLAQDDVDGVCWIYPRGESTRVCTDNSGLESEEGGGCGGCSAGGGESGLLLGGLVWLLAARRGRASSSTRRE